MLWRADEKDGTTPVGSYAASAFGLHDMHGNAREWVEDWSAGSYENARSDGALNTDGAVNIVLEGPNRVNGGGSWVNYPSYLRSAYRSNYTPTLRNLSIGFRLARSASGG